MENQGATNSFPTIWMIGNRGTFFSGSKKKIFWINTYYVYMYVWKEWEGRRKEGRKEGRKEYHIISSNSYIYIIICQPTIKNICLWHYFGYHCFTFLLIIFSDFMGSIWWNLLGCNWILWGYTQPWGWNGGKKIWNLTYVTSMLIWGRSSKGPDSRGFHGEERRILHPLAMTFTVHHGEPMALIERNRGVPNCS